MRIDPNPLDDYLETNTVGPKKILNKKTEVMISKILNEHETRHLCSVHRPIVKG